MTFAALEQKGLLAVNEWRARRKTREQERVEADANHEFIKQIALAKQSLNIARENFNFATDEAVMEYYIYMIKAEETKLNYYLTLAKNEKMKNPCFFTPRENPGSLRGCE